MDQNLDVVLTIIKCLAAALAGVLLGNGAVYFFNRMPASWFAEAGEDPPEAALDRSRQRIPSHPWKYVFTMLFVACGMWLVMQDVLSAVVILCILWILTELSISDVKFRILPDQLTILLAVCGLGMIRTMGSWRDSLLGGLIGFGIMALTALCGRLFSHRDAVGGGDIKLFTVLGILVGWAGILAVFCLTSLLSGAGAVYLLATKRVRRGDGIPMAPFITAAVLIYFLFLRGRVELLTVL